MGKHNNKKARRTVSYSDHPRHRPTATDLWSREIVYGTENPPSVSLTTPAPLTSHSLTDKKSRSKQRVQRARLAPDVSKGPTMQSVAVANGDHLEAFSNGSERDSSLVIGLDDTSESEPDVLAGGDSSVVNQDAPGFEYEAQSLNGNEMQDKPHKQSYSKPCPKSKKVGSHNNRENESGQTYADNESLGEKEPEYFQLPDETEVCDKLEESVDIIQKVSEETENKVAEYLEDDVQEREPGVDDRECDSGFQGNDHWEFQESTNEPTSVLENDSGKNQDSEGIVTEPEDETWEDKLNVDHKSPEQEASDMTEQVSGNISECNEQQAVTITAVDAESTSSCEENLGYENTNGSEAGFVEEPGEDSNPLVEFPHDSPKSPPKVLHHSDNPIDNPTGSNRGVKPKYKDLGDHEQKSSPPKQDDMSYSFARSLRSVSGRRPMKTNLVEQEEGASMSQTSQSSIFSFTFGKRKAEIDESPKKHATKRMKAETGEDSLGFFAKLTSPVMNRIRRLKVGSTVKNTPESNTEGWSSDSEEVVGLEEVPVTVYGSPQPSKWCSVM